MAELMLYAAGTASLTEYRLPYPEWRLDMISEDTTQARQLMDELDGLRALLIEHAEDVLAYMRPGGRKKAAPWSRQSLAILVLALDSAPLDRRPILRRAGVSLTSQDPIGDAQLLAEEWDLSHGMDPVITPPARV
jgi:hypothetical protein